MNGSLYDDHPVAGGRGTTAASIQQQQQQQQQGSTVNNGPTSGDDSSNHQLSPGSGGGPPTSGPLHIPAKRLAVGQTASSGVASAYHPQHHLTAQGDPNAGSGAGLIAGGLNGSSVADSSGTGGLLRTQPWPYGVSDVHGQSSGSFDPQSYSPSSLVRDGMAAAAAAYYNADRAKALSSFWPSDYGKYGAAAAAAAAGPSAGIPSEASAASAQFNAQAAWCGYAGYGTRVPEPHGPPGLVPAPGQPAMGVPVSMAGYLEAHEARRGAMDAAAAAAACGFPHDSYAGLRGYATGPDGMPPSVYAPGKFPVCFLFFFLLLPISISFAMRRPLSSR